MSAMASTLTGFLELHVLRECNSPPPNLTAHAPIGKNYQVSEDTGQLS